MGIRVGGVQGWWGSRGGGVWGVGSSRGLSSGSRVPLCPRQGLSLMHLLALFSEKNPLKTTFQIDKCYSFLTLFSTSNKN